jgi:hypothetical protein
VALSLIDKLITEENFAPDSAEFGGSARHAVCVEG